MKVFATKYLEPMSTDAIPENEEWTWTPKDEEVRRIYASGANTRTQTSTYAAEKDNRSDSDRPNEGMLIA